MINRFGTAAKAAIERAATVAMNVGAPRIDAEHLLLALAEGNDSTAATALRTVGISASDIDDALDREFQDSLIGVGVSAEHRRPYRRTSGANKRSPMGQSAKLAIERALEIAQSKEERVVTDGHLLLAITGTDAGLIPRLLAELGINTAQIHEAVDAGHED